MAMMAVLLFMAPSLAQDKTVTGKVTDAKGAAIAGVTVKLKGGKALTQTNSSGNFTVKVPAGTTLEFTSVGFSSIEMQVPESGTMSISMTSAKDDLAEVVVIGYGTAKKKDLTGSVVAVSSKDFVKGALTSPEQLITGKVAGVSITNYSGAPGAGGAIRVRGGASINASNNPLIIIDGVPLDNVDNSVAGSSGPLALINPNDIESFNILKDASAAAIYGSRASNGVILITTKRGKAGKPVYNFSSVISLYTPTKNFEVLSAAQFRNYVKANGSAVDTARLGAANTDWQNEIYKTAIGTDNNLSMTGSIFKTVPFRASIGYLNQQGILRKGSIKRTTASIAVSPKFFKDHLKVDLNIKGIVSENRFANEGAIGNAISFDPTQPIYNGTNRYGGYWQWIDPTNDKLNVNSNRNPVGLINQYDNRAHNERSIGNVQFDYKFIGFEDLKAVVNLGYDVARGHGGVIISDSAASDYTKYYDASTGITHGGVRSLYKQDKTNTVLDAYLNYNRETKIGKFEGLVGYTYQSFKTKNYNYSTYTYDNTLIPTSIPKFPESSDIQTIISVYGRLNYNYQGKYFLTASARKDGSSRFDKSNRWGIFPSMALAWKLKEEAFLKNNKWINELKLRVGVGNTGQQDGIGLYIYQPTYYYGSPVSQYQFGNTFYTSVTPKVYNQNIHWEKTETRNIALDFGFWNNRLSGTIEYYRRKTTDLLNDAILPSLSNFGNVVTTNIGSMDNNGLELTLNYGIIKKKDFTWDISYNLTYNENKITNLTIAPDPTFAGNEYGTIFINSVGFSRGAFYVYKQVYDPQTNKPIENLYVDLKKDGIINNADRYQYKQVDPNYYMGLTNNINYKKWSLAFVMRASIGNYVYNAAKASIASQSSALNTSNKFLSNVSTEVLSSNFIGGSERFKLSDYWIENASFLKMDNINVGYNVGKIFRSKADLRINANMQNVFTITKYSGLDPEIYGGADYNMYKRPRVFSVGLNLIF